MPAAAEDGAAALGTPLVLLGHFLFPQAPSLALQQALSNPSLTCLAPCLSFPPAETKRALATFLPTAMEIRHEEPEQQAGLVSHQGLAFQPGRSEKFKLKKRQEGFISFLAQD